MTMRCFLNFIVRAVRHRTLLVLADRFFDLFGGIYIILNLFSQVYYI
jgi:hypothetical protein